MSKNLKALVNIILSFMIIAVITVLIAACNSTKFFDTEEDYKIDDDTVVIFKEKDVDFKILNITDMQFNTTFDNTTSEKSAKLATYNVIDKLIDEVKPDLITMSGDIVWSINSKVAFMDFIDFIESYDILWAPIFGNHERADSRDMTEDEFCQAFENAEHCLFRRGPDEIDGCGNYVINIVERSQKKNEKGKIVESLIMLDSHEDSLDASFDGYDWIHDNQIKWYKETINKLTEINNNTVVDSTMYIHIPLPEYVDAYNTWEKSGFDPKIGFGEKNENQCCPKYNSGMFAAIKELNSTKNVIAGHDHINSYSVLYEGVRLTYGLKTGDRCYAKKTLNGGTILTISSDGVSGISHKNYGLSE